MNEDIMEHKDLIESQVEFIRASVPKEPIDLVLINLRNLIRKHLKRYQEITETRRKE